MLLTYHSWECGIPVDLFIGLTLDMLIFWETIIFPFLIIVWPWDGIDYWKPSSWETKACASYIVNILRLRQNGRRFAADMFKCIFLNESYFILIQISLKFVPRGPISNNPTLVQMMAWRRSGDKPLSEPMMISLLTHIIQPQWVNTLFVDDLAQQEARPSVGML